MLTNKNVAIILLLTTFLLSKGGVMDNKMLNVTEAAEFLRCSKRFIYQMCQDGTIPALKIGRQYLIPVNELNQWIHNRCGKKETV